MNAIVIEDDSRGWSKELTWLEPFLKEAPFEELCGDNVMVSATPCLGHIDPICVEPFDSMAISSPLFPTTPLICMHVTSA